MIKLTATSARRLPVICIVAAAFLVCRAALADTVSAPASLADRVTQSIEKAKAYLYSQQKEGIWENVPRRDPAALPFGTDGAQWGGLTALTTYALLAAGERPQDPRLKKAIDFLTTTDIPGIYAEGLRAQVWLFVPRTQEVASAIGREGDLFVNAIDKSGVDEALYNYYLGDPAHRIDHSASQYGVLGMWACAQNGYEPPSGYWEGVEQVWTQQQLPDGGWCYDNINSQHLAGAEQSTPSMTAAGVATLFITQQYTHALSGVDCVGNIESPAIDKGLAWIASHAGLLFVDDQHTYYTCYGVERIGVASGRKYFGSHDWYAEGASTLLQRQSDDGSWTGSGYGSVCNTAFALLFLSRGRAPVIMNKLEFPSAASTVATGGGDSEHVAAANAKAPTWNQRPRDLANLAFWAGREAEKNLNWQIVNLDAPAADLHDAPILYIAGADLPALDSQKLDKLRDFVVRGGMIYGNADCGNRIFATKFKALAKALFPQYKMRELPANHPIYTDQQFPRSKWGNKPSVLGVSNGVRELMVLTPLADPARAWQMNASSTHKNLFEFGADLYQYATDKIDGLVKGSTYIASSDDAVGPSKIVMLARLQYDGNWDPEPGGWMQLASVLHNQRAADLDVIPIKLGANELAKSGAKVAHLTGTEKIRLNAVQKDELKTFVSSGGTLIIDSAGGSDAFAESAEELLRETYPVQAASALLQPIRPDAPLYTFSKSVLGKVEYRRFAKTALGGNLTAPRIDGIDVGGGRLGVLYSRDDLSAGLVGEQVDGILGYTPESATELMKRLILYASR